MTPMRAALLDLLPAVRVLSRADKLRLLLFLAEDLLREEAAPLLEADACYEVLTPIDAFDAATILRREMDKAKGTP